MKQYSKPMGRLCGTAFHLFYRHDSNHYEYSSHLSSGKDKKPGVKRSAKAFLLMPHISITIRFNSGTNPMAASTLKNITPYSDKNCNNISIFNREMRSSKDRSRSPLTLEILLRIVLIWTYIFSAVILKFMLFSR